MCALTDGKCWTLIDSHNDIMPKINYLQLYECGYLVLPPPEKMEKLYQYINNVSHNRGKFHIVFGAIFFSIILLALSISMEPYKSLLFKWSLLDSAKNIIFPLLALMCFMIFIDYRNRTHSVSRISITKDELINKYAGHRDKIIQLNGIRLRSVKFHTYKSPPELSSLSIQKNPVFFQIPWYLEQYCKELISPFNPSKVFNGKTLRFEGFENGDSTKFRFSYATYFDYLISNGSHDQKLFNELTVRDLLEPGPKLSPLDAATCSNHLGLSVLIISSDGHILLQKRSKSTIVFSGQLSPSVSGAANIDTFENASGELSFTTWFETELREEVAACLGIKDFDSVVALGLSRELIRLGKPEIFLIAKSKICRKYLDQILGDEIRPKISQNEYHIRSTTQSPANISRSESEKFLWLTIKQGKNLQTTLREDYPLLESECGNRISISIENEEYLISESLAVNLALLTEHHA